MTVSTATSFNSYAGNGSTTSFAYAFKIFQDSNLVVTLVNDTTGVETTQTLTTDYTVTGAGSDSGGNVVFGTAPASGNTVVIRRVLPVTQETNYVPNDPFPAEAHEDALDKLTMLVQQEVASSELAVQFPEGDVGSGINNILPSVTGRSEKLLKFGLDGGVEVIAASDLSSAIIGANYAVDTFTGTGSTTVYTLSAAPGSKTNAAIYIDGVYQAKANYSVSGSTLTFTTAPPLNSAIEIVIGDAIPAGAATTASAVSYTQGGTGAVTTNVQAKLRETVSVKDFGAVGDGVTDDTAAIQAADAFAATVDGSIFFPVGTYKTTATLEPSFGVSWIGESSRQKAQLTDNAGVKIKPTSAVSRAISIVEKDSIRLINLFIDMENMSNRQVYTASTISFDAATNTINDSANGLGVFERGELIQITSGTTNQPYIIKDVSAGTITVHFLGVTAAAGSSVTITAGACGVWGNGYRRCVFDNLNINLVNSGIGWVGFNGHDGNRSTYYNRYNHCSIKPEISTTEGVMWALSSTDESALTAFTSNWFSLCIAQGGDFGWYFGGTGAGCLLTNCHGEGADTNGMWVADTASAFSTAVVVEKGEWSDVDSGKDGSLHLLGATVNGTIGSLVYQDLPGRLLGPELQLNSLRVTDSTISTGSGSSNDININPDGTGQVGLGTTTNIARRIAAHGGLEVYRGTATATADVFQVYSDVGGSQTNVFLVEADGDTLNATGSYGTISDNRLKQNITAASSQWSDIAAIDVVNYQLIALGDDAPTFLGVTAQQLEDAGIGGLVKTDEETGYKSVKYSILYMKAVKALQEAMDRIEQLEARVTELEP